MPDERTLPSSVGTAIKLAEGDTANYIAQRRAQDSAWKTGAAVVPPAPETKAAEDGEKANGAAAEDAPAKPAQASSGDDSPTSKANGKQPAPNESAQSADADAASEHTNADEPADAGEDPKWLKKRLARERRKFERQRQADAQSKDAEIAQLRAQLKSHESQPAAQSPAGAGKASLADYYPARKDYTNEAAFEKAVDDFVEGAELTTEGMTDEARRRFAPHGQATPATASQPATQQEAYQNWFGSLTPEQQQAHLAERARNEHIAELFSDVFELVGEGAGDEVREKFEDGIEDGSITMTEDMLRWLADRNDAHHVAEAFVQRPLRSRQIRRKPSAEAREKALKAIIDKAKGPKQQNKRAAGQVPDLDNAVSRGRANGLPLKPEDMPQREYNAMRRRQDRASHFLSKR